MTVGEVDRHQCRRHRKGSPNQDTLRKTISNMANHIRNMAVIHSPVRFQPKSIAELNNLRNTMSHKQYVTLYNKFRPYDSFPPLLGGNRDQGPRMLSGFGVRLKQHNRGILKSRQSQPPAQEDKVVPVENDMPAAGKRKMEVFVPCLSINKARIQPTLDGEDEDYLRHPERSRSSLSKRHQGEFIPGTISHRLSHLKNKGSHAPTYRMTNAGNFVKDPETNRYVHEIRRPATSMSSKQLENCSAKEYEIPKSQKHENRFKLQGQVVDGGKKVTFTEYGDSKVTRIETYFMSEKEERYALPKKDEPAPLTVRNLEIHQALLKPLAQKEQLCNENLEFITEVNRERITSWITERVRDIPELMRRHAEEKIADVRRKAEAERRFVEEENTRHSEYDIIFQGKDAENDADADGLPAPNGDGGEIDVIPPETESRPHYRLLKNMLTMSEFTCERIGVAEDLSSVATTELEKELGFESSQ